MDLAASSESAGTRSDRDHAAPLVIRRVPIDSLQVDPANARAHPERSIEGIKASLSRWGQAEPLVVHLGTNRVIGGNGRVVAMRALGWTHVDIVELDLTETQATALSIALNRVGELSEWSLPALGRLLEGLKTEDSLEGIGFDAGEIDELVAGLLDHDPGEIVEDEIPEPPEKATSRTGDLWILGRHRLLVGDSASAEDVDRLVAGAPIHLLNLDCPYNVKVEPRSNNAIAAGLSSFTGVKHHQKLDLARHPGKSKPTTKKLRAKDRPLTNDFLPDAEFAALLRKWFGNASRVLFPGRAFYVWGGYSNFANYPPALAEAGLYFSQAIIWDKQHPVLTRKDFMGAFEVCYYGWKEGAAHRYFGPNNATDLWPIKKVNPQSMSHITEKPVTLASRAIHYSSRPGENVLDLFGGSGFTMAAAEQTGRSAYLMEIDELYADVIVMRYERISGKQAVLEGSGKSYSDVKTERGAS